MQLKTSWSLLDLDTSARNTDNMDNRNRVLGAAFCSPALTLSEKLCPVSGRRVWSYKTQATRDVITRSGVGGLPALGGFG